MPDSRCRILDAGQVIHHVEKPFLIFNFDFLIAFCEMWEEDAGYRIPDAGCVVPPPISENHRYFEQTPND